MTRASTTTIMQGAALLFLSMATGAASADPAGMRSYRALAITADGARIAAIESVEGEAQTGPRVVVRERAGGRIVATYQLADCGHCRFDAPQWSPDQQALATIGTDAKAGSATVYLMRDGRLAPLASVQGVASTVRWSPDGRQLAFLATVGAK